MNRELLNSEVVAIDPYLALYRRGLESNRLLLSLGQEPENVFFGVDQLNQPISIDKDGNFSGALGLSYSIFDVHGQYQNVSHIPRFIFEQRFQKAEIGDNLFLEGYLENITVSKTATTSTVLLQRLFELLDLIQGEPNGQALLNDIDSFAVDGSALQMILGYQSDIHSTESSTALVLDLSDFDKTGAGAAHFLSLLSERLNIAAGDAELETRVKDFARSIAYKTGSFIDHSLSSSVSITQANSNSLMEQLLLGQPDYQVALSLSSDDSSQIFEHRKSDFKLQLQSIFTLLRSIDIGRSLLLAIESAMPTVGFSDELGAKILFSLMLEQPGSSDDEANDEAPFYLRARAFNYLRSRQEGEGSAVNVDISPTFFSLSLEEQARELGLILTDSLYKIRGQQAPTEELAVARSHDRNTTEAYTR